MFEVFLSGRPDFQVQGRGEKKNDYLKVVKLVSLHSWPSGELSAAIPSWFTQAIEARGYGIVWEWPHDEKLPQNNS